MDQAGNDIASLTQTLTAATWEAVLIGDVSSAGFGIRVESLEAKGGDSVEFAYDDTGTKRVYQTMPSAMQTILWPTATLYARALVTDHRISIAAFEI